MIISEKQIWELLNIARYVSLQNEAASDMFKQKTWRLISEIECQQSEKLKEINDE
jgi:hypothetical protein